MGQTPPRTLALLLRLGESGDFDWRDTLGRSAAAALAALPLALSPRDEMPEVTWPPAPSRKPVDAAELRDLFVRAWRCGLAEEAETAAAVIATHPREIAPQRAVPAALEGLFREEGLAGSAAYLLLWRHAADSLLDRMDDISQRSNVGWWPEPKDRWVLYQDAVLPHHFKGGPRVRGVSHRITARIERESTDQDGAIIADGGRFGGWSVFIRGNRLHYTTNNFGARCRISSPAAIPPGAVTLRADVVRTGEDEGRVRFYVDDEPAGEGVPSPFRQYNFVNEPLDVGRDSQTPVDDLYESPFVFKGTIVDVVIEAFGEEVMDYEVLLEELMASQ